MHRTPLKKMIVLPQNLTVWGMQQILNVVGSIFVNSTQQQRNYKRAAEKKLRNLTWGENSQLRGWGIAPTSWPNTNLCRWFRLFENTDKGIGLVPGCWGSRKPDYPPKNLKTKPLTFMFSSIYKNVIDATICYKKNLA